MGDLRKSCVCGRLYAPGLGEVPCHRSAERGAQSPLVLGADGEENDHLLRDPVGELASGEMSATGEPLLDAVVVGADLNLAPSDHEPQVRATSRDGGATTITCSMPDGLVFDTPWLFRGAYGSQPASAVRHFHLPNGGLGCLRLTFDGSPLHLEVARVIRWGAKSKEGD